MRSSRRSASSARRTWARWRCACRCTIRTAASTLFALNRAYLLNDKTALAEVAELERAPTELGPRVQELLAHPGALANAVASVEQLLRETIELTAGLYRSRYELP